MVSVNFSSAIQRDPSPVVVLLGAGASKDAGLPLSMELTIELRKELENRGDRRLCEALGLILGGLAFQNGIKGNSTQAVPDIESVVRVAQQLARRNEQPLATYVGSWHPALEQLAPNGDGIVFQSLMSVTTEMLREKLKLPDQAIKYKYLADVTKLNRDSHYASTPPIFTLNYDFLLEAALKHEQKTFTTGFQEGVWDRTEFNSLDRTRIYKIHGSFGWVRDSQTSLLYNREEALQRKDVFFESPDTPDELIFGADNKLRAVHPFLWMFYQFDEAVSNALFIITIGYGFADEHINQMIYQGLARDEAKRLVVVGPGLDEKKLQGAPGMTLFPNRTSFISEGAKSALTERESILSKLQELRESATSDDPFSEK